MVTPNQEPEPEAVQAPLPESPPDTGGDEFVAEVNPLIAETDRLNNIPDVDISGEPEPSTESSDSGLATTTEGSPENTTTTTETTEETPAPNVEAPPQQQLQLTPQQLQELQRQALEYEQVRQKAAVQQQQTQIQKQLESQGASPEEAFKEAQQYVSSQNAQRDLVKQADQYGQQLVAKQNAAEHFATKYELQLTDLNVLKQAETPEIMEQLAKEIQGRRKMESRLAEFEKSQVPAQQFDNSQGAPEVASSDGNWLDRYNAGDRSPNAVAAAKRVMGIQ